MTDLAARYGVTWKRPLQMGRTLAAVVGLTVGASKSAFARRVGIRDTIHRWILADYLDRDLDAMPVRDGPPVLHPILDALSNDYEWSGVDDFAVRRYQAARRFDS
jgi:hypothetical protein